MNTKSIKDGKHDCPNCKAEKTILVEKGNKNTSFALKILRCVKCNYQVSVHDLK